MGCCLLLWETLLHFQRYWNGPSAITPTWRRARSSRFMNLKCVQSSVPLKYCRALPVITIQFMLAASEQTSSAALTTVVQCLATREGNSCCCCLLQRYQVSRDRLKVRWGAFTTGWLVTHVNQAMLLCLQLSEVWFNIWLLCASLWGQCPCKDITGKSST